MSALAPIVTIAVGIVVDRSKGAGPWTAYLWRTAAVLTGAPETPPWTVLSHDNDRTTFYAGAGEIELYRTETGNYRDNLAADPPLIWIALPSAEEADPPFGPPAVTVDPAEGEAWAGAPELLVDAVPMPDLIRDRVAAFVAQHHVEQEFSKRKRNRADPEALGRREPKRQESGNAKPDRQE